MPPPLFLLLVGVLCTGSYLVVAWFSNAGKRRLAKRARQFGRGDRRRQDPSAGPRLRRETGGGLDALVLRFLPRPQQVRARLAASGMSWSVGRYGLFCAAIAIAAAALTMARGMPPLTAVLIGAGAGIAVPHMIVGSRIKQRQARFNALFPDAISLMVRGLKAGLPFADTVLVVGREVADPLGEEFRRISDQIKLGQKIEDAMWLVARRLDLPEFNFLIVTLSVQRETGGNLAATLENLEEMLRKREQMRLKVKAMSSEAKASAGIIGALPFVMATLLYFVSHDYIMQLFTTHKGHFMLLIGSGLLGIGVFAMSRMVKFQI
ncbi:MAG TPA: type II secretion system F family protein [Alphaproteobacteria bacterium]|jgi:tight adherence protein B|nr:type II secretion system F family protein [Alphaproteobacteria bacterium]